MYEYKLHVGKPNIGDRAFLFELIEGILDEGRLTNNGSLVQMLESMICDLTGAKHAIAVSNATRGLEITTRALDMNKGVIVPSFTFIATPNALL